MSTEEKVHVVDPGSIQHKIIEPAVIDVLKLVLVDHDLHASLAASVLTCAIGVLFVHGTKEARQGLINLAEHALEQMRNDIDRPPPGVS